MSETALNAEIIRSYKDAAPLLLKPDLAAQAYSGVKTVTTRLQTVRPFTLHQNLYVRESWRTEGVMRIKGSELPIGTPILYAADLIREQRAMQKWRPSLFLPKWGSRTIVQVISIRETRLQDLSDEELLAEGFSGCLSEIRKKWELFWRKTYGDDLWQGNAPCRVYRFQRNPQMIAQWQLAAKAVLAG